jgi:hypothetical protein
LKTGQVCPVLRCHLNTRPFDFRTQINHLHTGLAQYSDGNCRSGYCRVLCSASIKCNEDSNSGHLSTQPFNYQKNQLLVEWFNHLNSGPGIINGTNKVIESNIRFVRLVKISNQQIKQYIIRLLSSYITFYYFGLCWKLVIENFFYSVVSTIL